MDNQSLEGNKVGCPTLKELPPPPAGRTGWPWTEESPPLPESMPDGRPWPRVSVVTPSYNQGRFIEETIRSVLLQGYPNLEYLILDGGSSDGSVDIIRRYEPWLSFWVSEPDRGQADAINKGWKRASGEFVTWLNSDDLLLPSSLERTVSALAREDRVQLVYGDALLIDAESRPYPVPFDRFRGRPLDLEDVILSWRSPVPQQGFLMRRSVLDQIGYLDEGFQFSMDFEYWLRLALAGGQSEYLSCTLAAFRRHGETKTHTMAQRRIRENYAIYDQTFSRQLPRQLQEKAKVSRASLHLQAVYVSYLAGNVSGMWRYALCHIRQSGLRSSPRAWLFLIISLGGDRFVSALRESWRAFRVFWARRSAEVRPDA